MPGRRSTLRQHPPTTVPLPFATAVATVMAIVALVTGCTGGEGSDPGSTERPGATEDSAATTAPAPGGYEPILEDSTCTDPTTPTDLRCQTLVVPESRDRPNERQVELPVLRVGEPSENPIVYLHGGPGAGAVQGWGSWSALADGLGRELIVYDQRGGGQSTPRLDCPERDDALLQILSGTTPWPESVAMVAAGFTDCRNRLRAEGIDLDQYDTPASTQDLEDLRRALDVSTMTLVGVSYGTRLALDYVHTHPEHVSSLVLDSVDAPGTAGPTVERELAARAAARLVEACAADPSCHRTHPDLATRLDQAVQRFRDVPYAATLPASDDGRRPERTLQITGDEIWAGVFTALYDTDVIPLIPTLIDRLAAGDTSVIDLIVRRNVAHLFDTAAGATASVNCADQSLGDGQDAQIGYQAEADADPGRSATLVLSGTDSFCGPWAVEPVEREFLGDGRTSNPPPTLVVAGELDPITPADGSSAVAEEFDATYLLVPRGGHAPMLTNPCARSVLRSFLKDSADPDLSCTADLTPTPFN